jgi:hypothetical protein
MSAREARRQAVLSLPKIKGCDGKFKYNTKKFAAAVASTRSHRAGSLIREYHCPRCQKWHIGHEQRG